MKRYLLSFQKIGFILKVSLDKILSTRQKIQYALKVSLPQFDKFECLMNLILKLKMSIEKTHSTIPKNFNLYKMCQRWRCLFKRRLIKFQKIRFILKVSLEKTLSTIPQNPIYILKFVEMILKLKMSFFSVWKHFQYKPNFFKIMEGVSSRDTFNIIPFLGIVKGVSWHFPQF